MPAENTACASCGHVGWQIGEFHPYAFCLAKRDRPDRDPWIDFRDSVKLLTGVDLGDRPPLVRDLPIAIPGQKRDNTTTPEEG